MFTFCLFYSILSGNVCGLIKLMDLLQQKSHIRRSLTTILLMYLNLNFDNGCYKKIMENNVVYYNYCRKLYLNERLNIIN